MKEYSKWGPVILRVSLSLVFLYFGLSQLINPASFVGYLPEQVASLPMAQTTFVLLNGILEVALGLLLILGVYTRLCALILGAHLLVIGLSFGFSQTGIRDLGLSLATLSLALSKVDFLTVDAKHTQKKLV